MQKFFNTTGLCRPGEHYMVDVLELKLKYDSETRADGLRQTARYMDAPSQQHGYLVLFELKKSDLVPWEERLRWTYETWEDKHITVVEM